MLNKLIIYILLIIVTAITLGPFLWTVSNSLMTQEEITSPDGGVFIPHEPTTKNYGTLLDRVNFGTYMTNTIFVAGATALLTTLVSAMGGYALAKFEFFGKRLVTLLMLGTMLLPAMVMLVPLFKLVHAMGLIDNFWALIIPVAANGFGVLIMRQYLNTVPAAVIDAARIDGAGEIRIFWTVVLPLVRPIISALTIFTFLTAWNSYLWPMIILRNQDNYLLTVAVTNVVCSLHQQEYGVVLAGTVISVAPIILLFLALQREFISGLTLGAVKQ